MRSPELGIGESQTMPNGFSTAVAYEDPTIQQRDSVKVGKVAKYEAEHVVVAENLGIRAKRLRIISDKEGVAEVSEANPIVAATHIGDGDAHDRRVVVSLGMDPSEAAMIANQEKFRGQAEIGEVSREAALRGELNGYQIRNAMRDGKEGRRVVVTLYRENGVRSEEIKTRAKGRVMIPNNWYELPPINPPEKEWIH